MEQNVQNTLEFYQELISNGQKLQQGAELITEKLSTQETFANETFSILMEGSTDSQTKHFIGCLIKRPLLDNWNNNQNISAQKNTIREMLLHSIISNVGDLRVIETISQIMGEMIKLDGINIWADPLKEIISWMQTENSEVTDTSLELFCNLFYILDRSLNSIVQPIMPVLFQKFADPDLNEKQREKLLVLLYLIITSFSHADGTNNQLVKLCFEETYEIWMSLFISALNSSPKSHINIKRYILKIMTVIFRDFTYYSRKSIIPCLNPIWAFFNKVLPLYGWNICYDVPVEQLDQNTLFPPKDYPLHTVKESVNKENNKMECEKPVLDLDLRFFNNEDECDNDVEGLTLQIIELVGTIVTKEQLYMVIKFAVFPLVNALAHLMIMTRRNEKLWIYDPNLFIAEEDDEVSMRSLRNVCSKLVFELIEKFGDQATQALMIVSEKFLLNLQEKQTLEMIDNLYKKLNLGDLKQYKGLDFNKEKLMQYVKGSNFECEHVDHVWKRREVGLLILGDFSDDIIYFTSKHSSSFEISHLINNLMLEINSDQCIPILQSKALLTISRFAEIIGSKNPELFLPLYKVSSKCLSRDHQIPVRMTATKAIGVIVAKIERYRSSLDKGSAFEEHGLNNTDIILDIFDVMQYTSEDTVYIILDTLIALNQLSDIYTPVIAEIGKKHILHIFTLFHSEIVIGKSIIELIQQLAKNKQSYQIVFDTFAPFILDCIAVFNQSLKLNNDINALKPSDLTLMGSIFEVTGIFITNSNENNQCEELMKLLQPLITLMLLNLDTTLQVQCSLCLKNFIKIVPQHIIKHNLVPEVKKVIEKLIEVPKDSTYEGNSQNSGNVIMLMFNNLLNGEPDAEILKKLVYKIQRSRIPSIVQGLVLVYARMINNNPGETVKFLNSFQIENRPALKVLIDKWLLQQPVFRGKSTKNCAYQALINLFLLKDQNLQTLLVLAYNPSHTNVGNAVNAPYKIFSTLIRGLDNEMAPSRKDKNLIKQAQDQIQSNDFYDGERMETMEDDDDDDLAKRFNNLNDENNIKQVEVDLDIEDADDTQEDIERRLGEKKKGGGLGDLENTGSTCYMTEGFAFGQYDDDGEGDENLEEDLIYLKDPSINQDTSELLIKFFEDLAKNDPQYFQQCVKNLLKEDIEKLQKYIIFKNQN